MTSTEPGQIVTFADGTTYDFGKKDWSYLQGKATSSNHEMEAAAISQLSGVEISAKQVQALLSMHRFFQASEANRARPEFHGRTWESVVRGSATLAERAAEKTGQVVSEPIGALVEPAAAPKPKPAPRRRAAKAPAKTSA